MTCRRTTGLPLDSVRARRNPFPGQETRMASDGPTEWANCKFVFDMCELQVHHLQLLACERTRRSEKERARLTRKARTRHRRMRLPLSQINVHLCLRKKERRERKRERGSEKVYDRFDDPCQLDRESVTGASQRGQRTPTTKTTTRRTTRKPPFSLRICLPILASVSMALGFAAYTYMIILSRYYRTNFERTLAGCSLPVISDFFHPAKIEHVFDLDIRRTGFRVRKIY